MTTRVRWIHRCVSVSCGYNDRGGTVWRPSQRAINEHDGLNDWEIARAYGLTADPKPHPDKQFAMVSWDCRQGVLQCHYWDELEVIE